MDLRITVLAARALAMITAAAGAQADLMPATGAELAPNFVEIDVTDGAVGMVLEVDPADYAAFFPGGPPLSTVLEGGANRLPSTTAIIVQDGSGTAITPSVRAVQAAQRTARPALRQLTSGSGLIPPPLEPSANVIRTELTFDLSGAPDRLVISPPMAPGGTPAATLGFLLRHDTVPVTDYRYLSQPEAVNLDWDDPWFTAFDNSNLTRHHKSPLMGFLTVDPREVRLEMILRLRDLEPRIAPMAGNGLDADAIAAIRTAGADFLGDLGTLAIDGTPTAPDSVRIDVLEVGVAGIGVIDAPETLDRDTALLGAVLSYPRSGLPQQIEFDWPLFADAVDTVPLALADPAGTVPARVTRDDPAVRWTNYLRNWRDPQPRSVPVEVSKIPLPAVSAGLGLAAVLAAYAAVRRPGWRSLFLVAAVGCAAGALFALPLARITVPIGSERTLEDARAAAIMEALLTNSAIALLDTTPERMDANLTPFVTPEAVPDVGTELRRAMSVSLPSGARGQIDRLGAVRIDSVSESGDGATQILARWQAELRGGHYGHEHRRRFAYRGLFDVSPKDGIWVIDGVTILDSEPVA